MSKRYTPPQLAELWSVSPDQIVKLIHGGELEAINVATRPSGRPRYLIAEESIARFELRRSAAPQPRARRRRRRIENVKEYF